MHEGVRIALGRADQLVVRGLERPIDDPMDRIDVISKKNGYVIDDAIRVTIRADEGPVDERQRRFVPWTDNILVEPRVDANHMEVGIATIVGFTRGGAS